jgi:hypothetical protein
MNQLNVTYTGGQPIYLDDIAWNDSAYRAAMNGILLAFGTDFIVQGCNVSGSSVSAGYIMLNSQLIQVDAHTSTGAYYALVTTDDSSGNDNFQDGSTAKSVYKKNRGVANAGSGTLSTTGQRLTDKIIALAGTLSSNYDASGTAVSVLANLFAQTTSNDISIAQDGGTINGSSSNASYVNGTIENLNPYDSIIYNYNIGATIQCVVFDLFLSQNPVTFNIKNNAGSTIYSFNNIY